MGEVLGKLLGDIPGSYLEELLDELLGGPSGRSTGRCWMVCWVRCRRGACGEGPGELVVVVVVRDLLGNNTLKVWWGHAGGHVR